MSSVVPAIGFGIITASILSLAAVGFTLQFGATNILNLAYGDIMTACAFMAYIATRDGVNIWIALVFSGLFGALFSAALNRFAYVRFIRRGTQLFGMIILSIAASIVIQNVLLAIWGASFYSLPVSQGRTFHIATMVFTTTQLVIIAIAAAAMLSVHLLLKFTRLGRAMRATATDAALARDCGVSTERVVDIVWLISGGLCGLAGAALAMNVTSITATTGSEFLIPIIAAAVLGGVGQPYGAMLGALVIGISSEVAAAVIAPSYKEVVAFVILIIVLLVRPQGILSEIATQKEVVM